MVDRLYKVDYYRVYKETLLDEADAQKLHVVAVDTCDRCQLPKGRNVTLTHTGH